MAERTKREGPKVTISYSCSGCSHERSERYVRQGDSGYIVSCALTTIRVGDTNWETPDWCPLLTRAEVPRWSINFDDDDVPEGLTDPKAKLSAVEWVELLGKGVLCSTEC